ncbi:hypothetical protein [Reichenbachiella sp.]
MKSLVITVFVLFEALTVYGQEKGKWILNQDKTIFEVPLKLIDPPRKIEFLINSYEANASLKYDSSGIAYVSNIRWGGSFSIDGYGGSLNTTLEDAIFNSKGKVKPHWEKKTKEGITKAILSELETYQ